MIRFRCPKCSEVMEAPAGMANEFLKCPKCQQVVQVPKPVEPKPAKSKSKDSEYSALDHMQKAQKVLDADIIRFRCECGQAVSTPEKNAGKLGECPICREDVRIPHQSTR